MEKSESIAKLAKALSLAQGEFPEIPCNRENPYYKSKYADLQAIISSVFPVLSKHGLSIVQTMNATALDYACLSTTLMHESGEFLISEIALKPGKNDAQGMGSAYTYARRYALSAILSVSSEYDDDGNGATAKDEHKKEAKPEHKEDAKQPVNFLGAKPPVTPVKPEQVNPPEEKKAAPEPKDAENIPVAYLKSRIKKAIAAGFDKEMHEFLEVRLKVINKELEDLDKDERKALNADLDDFSAQMVKKKAESKAETKKEAANGTEGK